MVLRQACRAAAARVDAQLQAWATALPSDAGAALRANGYYVVDGAVSPALSQALRDEIASLAAADALYPNATHVYVKDAPRPLLLEKAHIHETELADMSADYASLHRWFDNPTLRTTCNALLPSLRADRHMIKVQYNDGHGGCFPMHFDTYGDDGKCLTAVLYLNERWAPGDGGEIVLFPFPYAPITIAPAASRLVLFSSHRMLHRVLPSRAPRYCLTTWMYRDPSLNAAYPPPRTHSNGYDTMLAKVCASPFRAHLAKLAYADEWRQSLIESHATTPSFAAYLQSYDAELDVIAAATDKMLATFRKKSDDIPSCHAAFTARLRAEKSPASDLVAWF